MSTALETALEAAAACYEAGDLAAAESACSEILRKAPRNTHALHLLGTICFRMGDAQRASALFEKLARLRPGDDRVLEALALAQLAEKAHVAAEGTLRRAVKVAASSRASLHVRLAYVLNTLERYDEAEDSLRAALRIEPANAEVLLALGNALARQGRGEEARQCFAQAAELEPHRPDARFNLAVLLERDGRYEEAAQAYVEIVPRFPQYVDAHINLGIVCERLDRNNDAIRCYQQALTIDKNSVHALTNLSKVLRTEHRLEEAKAASRQALQSQPDFVDAIVNHAGVLADQGDARAALAEYEKALQLSPQAPDIHLSYGMLHLSLGDFAKGWRSYAWRPTRLRARAAGLETASILPESLQGEDVLLLGEQGLGDELFFLRYAHNLKSRGARVHVQCHPRLAPLLERTRLYDSVLTSDEPTPQADHAVIVGDLPLLLCTDACPPPLGLTALDDRVQRLTARFADLGPAPYVGLTWRSGTPPRLQRDRHDRALYKEIAFDVLRVGLQSVPGTLLALQRQPEIGEVERLGSMLGRPVHDFTYANEDLEEMLALLAALDEYVGVSNTNMHLMAGLGRAARVLVPHPPEWRWMWTGTNSPWFPGFHIYRQMPDHGWNLEMRRLCADLGAALRE